MSTWYCSCHGLPMEDCPERGKDYSSSRPTPAEEKEILEHPMDDPITIPENVVEAAARAMWNAGERCYAWNPEHEDCIEAMGQVRIGLESALAEWGAAVDDDDGNIRDLIEASKEWFELKAEIRAKESGMPATLDEAIKALESTVEERAQKAVESINKRKKEYEN